MTFGIERKISCINYVVVTSPANPAITLSEAKTHLRIDGSDYDDLINPLLQTVTDYAEQITGRDMLNTSYKGFLNKFPLDCQSVEIRKSKLQSVSSIEYYKNNSLQTFDSVNYFFTESNDLSSISLYPLKVWPCDIDNRSQSVVINFTAGYGASASDIPQGLKDAMLRHLTLLFENGGDCNVKNSQFTHIYKPFVIYSKQIII